MNTLNPVRSYPPSLRASPWLHAGLWLMLAAVGVLLTAFIAVINATIERGELRRENQRVSGSRLLPDEQASEAVVLGEGRWVSAEQVASADQP